MLLLHHRELNFILPSLWGMSCLQLYIYFEVGARFDRIAELSFLFIIKSVVEQRYMEKDKLWLKLYAFTVWAFDTAHQGMIIKAVYVSCVKDFGNILALAHFER